MKRKVVSGTLGLAVIIALTMSAQAAPKRIHLHGEYALTGTRVCVQTNGNNVDFTPPYYQLPVGGTGGTTRSAFYDGRLQLNRDGTGGLTVKALQINHQRTNAGDYPVLGFINICEATYQGLEDGTIELRLTNCDGLLTAGSPPGNTAGLDSPEILSVAVSANGDTLLLSDTEADVETVWSTVNSGTVFNYSKRICGRSWTAIRLSPRP